MPPPPAPAPRPAPEPGVVFPAAGITPSEAVGIIYGFDDGAWPRWDQAQCLLAPASLRVPGIEEALGAGGRLPRIPNIDPAIFRPDNYFRRSHVVQRRLMAAARLWDTVRDALPVVQVGPRSRADVLESIRPDLLRLVLGPPATGFRLAAFAVHGGIQQRTADHAASADGSLSLGASIAATARVPPYGGPPSSSESSHGSAGSGSEGASDDDEDTGTAAGVGPDARTADLRLFGWQVERAVLDLAGSNMAIRSDRSRDWTPDAVLQEHMTLVTAALVAIDRWVQAHDHPVVPDDGDARLADVLAAHLRSASADSA